jgi:chemotaxis protein MotB
MMTAAGLDSKMPRPKKQQAHENHERWLLTYADMITLLVAFFIMLYAMSVMNQHKFEQIAISVRSGFGGTVQGADSILDGSAQSTAPMSMSEQVSGNLRQAVQNIQPRIKQKAILIPSQNGSDPQINPNDTNRHSNDNDMRTMEMTLDKLKKIIKQQHLEKIVAANLEERGIVVTVLTDNMILDAMSGPLKAIPNEVRVEGYTDDLPISTARFPTNWELSTARATNVLRYFIDHNEVPPDRLSAAGYADTRPICPNTSEDNRALNRRVEIVVLKSENDSPSI